MYEVDLNIQPVRLDISLQDIQGKGIACIFNLISFRDFRIAGVSGP